MIKHFYIFRHGETPLNAAGRFQGQGEACDVGLNEKGRQQATQLAEHLTGKGLEVIVSSPLKRALETAEIVCAKLNIPLIIEPKFIEGNLGTIEGKTMEELTPDEREIFPYWGRMDKNFFDIRFENGESKQEILDRAFSGLRDLIKSPYQCIGIATHSTVLRKILMCMGRKQHTIKHSKAYHLIYEDGSWHIEENDKILLLSCCAPCSCAVIEKMAQEKRNFSVVFYNPNIRPYEEYQKRCAENKRVCAQYGVEFIELEYDNPRWQTMTRGLENEPERGKRCSICFHMRLKRVMEYAKANGFTAVASVLGVSRWKNLNQVNEIADIAARSTDCPYLEIEGRKNGMQQRRAELIKELNLYNQTYCGCKPAK